MIVFNTNPCTIDVQRTSDLSFGQVFDDKSALTSNMHGTPFMHVNNPGLLEPDDPVLLLWDI